MSVPNPTPNNLTQVLFGPLLVDFTAATTYTLGQLEYDENLFVPTNAFITYTNTGGTNSTQAVVAIDNGTTGDNIATATLPATPVAAIDGTGNRSQTILALTNPGYILGRSPVANANPAPTAAPNGAASVQSLRVNVTTAAIPSLATTNRSTANNISTLTVASVPSWLVAGSMVSILTVGNAGYNGNVSVLSVTGTTFSYYNPSVATEASTADTAGRIGALQGNVYVAGFLI